MAKFPINIGQETVELREFDDGDDHIAVIDERHYRVHHTNDGKQYFMTKIRGASKPILGTAEQIRHALASVHLAYKKYERTVQKRKEEAQRVRDAALSKIVETYR